MARYPKSDRAWAAYVARIVKTTKPWSEGGEGLGSCRRLDAPFQGGYPDYPANSDAVAKHYRGMLATDAELRRAVIRHGGVLVGDLEQAKAIEALASHPNARHAEEAILANIRGAS